MKNKILYISIILVFVIFVGVVIFFMKNKTNNEELDEPVVVINTGDFTIDLLKRINKKENYLISPYSIEVALDMLRQGTSGTTKEELDKVLPQRNLTISNDKVKISNALFINDLYKSVIEKTFENNLKNKYNSKVLYDEFKTPKVINDWVKESTDGMIEKILDSIDLEFVLGLANAIAIDAKWVSEFECNDTRSEEFNVSNNKTINVEMMHKFYKTNLKYLDEENIKGVIIPYQEDLEFVALLPKEDLRDYISNLTKEELTKDLSNFKDIASDDRVNLSLPRFSYEYDIDNFITILRNLGINKVFDSAEADFSKIITKENLNKLGKENIYVSDAIHKTYIDLNEKGTKAAAVTYFGMKALGAFIDDKMIDIEFNRPFMYMIRDNKTSEILFLGSVYEPNKWRGTTCKKD